MTNEAPEARAILFITLAAMNIIAISMYWYSTVPKTRKIGNSSVRHSICCVCQTLLDKSNKSTSTSEIQHLQARSIKTHKVATKHGLKRNKIVRNKPIKGKPKSVVTLSQIPQNDDIARSQEATKNIAVHNGSEPCLPKTGENSNLDETIVECIGSSLTKPYRATKSIIKSINQKYLPAAENLNDKATEALRLEKHIETYAQTLVATINSNIGTNCPQAPEGRIQPMIRQNAFQRTFVLYNNFVNFDGCISLGQKMVRNDLTRILQPMLASDSIFTNGAPKENEDGDKIPTIRANHGDVTETENTSPIVVHELSNGETGEKNEFHAKMLTLRPADETKTLSTNPQTTLTLVCREESLELPMKTLLQTSQQAVEALNQSMTTVGKERRLECFGLLSALVMNLFERWDKKLPLKLKGQTEPKIPQEQVAFTFVKEILSTLVDQLELNTDMSELEGIRSSSTVDFECVENVCPFGKAERQMVVWKHSFSTDKEKHEPIIKQIFFDSGARVFPEREEEDIQLKRCTSQESLRSWKISSSEEDFFECDGAKNSKECTYSDFSDSDSAEIDEESSFGAEARKNSDRQISNDTSGSTSVEPIMVAFFGPDSVPLGSSTFIKEVTKRISKESFETKEAERLKSKKK